MDSQQEAQMLGQLRKMKDLIYSKEWANTFHKISDKDVIILLGNTKSGKSTIVNYIIGNELRVESDRRKNKIFSPNANGKNGPKIGCGAPSETTVPTVWSSPKLNELIVDAPGFDDNRGVVQDVGNSFYIKEIISNVRSAKFVLVVDINDLVNDSITSFINLLDTVDTILKGESQLHQGTLLVVNKDNNDHTNEEICYYLKEKIISQRSIELANRNLVKFFYEKKSCIVISKMPKSINNSMDDCFGNIITGIQKCCLKVHKTNLSKISTGISAKSRVYLYKAHACLTELEEFENLFKNISTEFNKKLALEIEKSQSSKDTLLQLKTDLSNMLDRLNTLISSNFTLKEYLLEIGKILPDMVELKEESDIYMKLRFIQFVDSLLDFTKSQVFLMRIKSTLLTMKESTYKHHINTLELLYELSNEESRNKIKEVEQEMANTKQALQGQIDELKEKQERSERNLDNECQKHHLCSIL